MPSHLLVFSSFDKNKEENDLWAYGLLFHFKVAQSDGIIKLDKRCSTWDCNIPFYFFFFQKTDNHGCISKLVKTKLFQLKRTGYENKLHVDAKIEEEETGMNDMGQRAR